MNVLVTGGAGYIGSHTVAELVQHGYQVHVADNFCNSSMESLGRIANLLKVQVPVSTGDIRDAKFLNSLFSQNDFDAVIHFAGLKSVSESVAQPISYYENNVTGTVELIKAMSQFGVKKLLFSSSATVYGDSNNMPVSEEDPIGSTTNPYGTSKYIVERILNDLAASDPSWGIGILRYFNPAGAHSSGVIGEDPNGIPNNLMPYISQVAAGKLSYLKVFGDDYPTPDGTGVRDYIHVVDLARGHTKALEKLQAGSGLNVYNLGTGQGVSVLQVIAAFEKANNIPVPFKIVARRPGDIPTCYANVEKARSELNWVTKYSLEDMMRDSWHWQCANPYGYKS